MGLKPLEGRPEELLASWTYPAVDPRYLVERNIHSRLVVRIDCLWEGLACGLEPQHMVAVDKGRIQVGPILAGGEVGSILGT